MVSEWLGFLPVLETVAEEDSSPVVALQFWEMAAAAAAAKTCGLKDWWWEWRCCCCCCVARW